MNQEGTCSDQGTSDPDMGSRLLAYKVRVPGTGAGRIIPDALNPVLSGDGSIGNVAWWQIAPR